MPMDHKSRVAVPALILLWSGFSLPALGVELKTPDVSPELPSAVAAPSLPSAALPELSAGLSIPAAPSLPAAPAIAVPEQARIYLSPAAAQAAAVAQGRFGSIVEQLSAPKLAAMPAEQGKDLADRAIDGSAPRAGSSDAGDAVSAGGDAAQTPSGLSPSQPQTVAPALTVPGVTKLERPSSLRQRLSDRINFQKLWAAHLWFYVVTNIRMKFPPYYAYWKKRVASGEIPPVSKPREFFSYMRVMGQTGEFFVLGFAARDDQAVVKEAGETFRKYFDAPEIKAQPGIYKAFDGFVERARNYNVERRAPSNFRKLVRDNMLKASTLPVAKLESFFDGLYRDQARTSDFQHGGAAAILNRFQEIVDEELRKEPEGVRGRIRGVVLIGSFASGAATPTSDFDGELVTDYGSPVRVQGFIDRVLARWNAEGRQKTNPVTFHEHPLPFSRRVIRMVHDCPYLVISPDPAVVSELAMRPGEAPAFRPSPKLTAKGRALRWLQYAAVYASTFLPAEK